MKIRLNHDGMRRILMQEAAPICARIADRVAATTIALVGGVDGQPVDARRFDEPTGQRARSAVLFTHPTAAGRRAAREAAEAALRVSGET